MSFGYAAGAVLDRPETDGGTPESGQEDTSFELISTYGQGVVGLTLRQRQADQKRDSGAGSTIVA